MSRMVAIGLPRVLWLVCGMAMATLPFATRLPVWLTLAIVIVAGWRIHAEWRGLVVAPPLRLRVLTSALVIGALVIGGDIGFGLDAATPLFVAFLWVKLLELKAERDFMLAAFLSFFLVAVLLYGEQSLALCAYAVLVIGVLTAALIGFHGGRTVRGVARTAGVILVQATPLALLLFLFIPRVQIDLPNLSGQAVAGFSETLRPGDVERIALGDQVVMRVEFPDGVIPPADQLYWRGLVLNETDGTTWRTFRPTIALTAVVPDSVPVVRQEITLSPTNHPWLFALDAPVQPPFGTRLLVNRTLHRGGIVGNMLRYEVSSQLGLSAVDDDRLSSRVPALDERVVELATTWRTQTADGAELVALALAWFQKQGFTYSLEPGRMGGDAVATFLFARRSGFCSHYATAFCLLMRQCGVPARVVVGYRGGEINPVGGFLVVRQEHAHAWAEVLIDRHWQRIDPTAGIPLAPGQTAPAAQRTASGQVVTQADRTPKWLPDWIRGPYRSSSQWWQYVEARWDGWAMGYDTERQGDLLGRLGLRRLGLFGALAVLVIGLGAGLLALAVLLRWWSRRTPRAPLPVIYADFCARLAAVGVHREPWEGPQDFAQRAANAVPVHSVAIAGITASYIAVRYGMPSDPAAELRRLQLAVRAFHPTARSLTLAGADAAK